MTYHLVSPRIGAQVISETSATQKMNLGEEVKAQDSALFEGNFIYVIASNSITQYDAVAIKHGFKVAPLTITNAKTAVEIGFAQVANGTKDTYMYVMKGGRPIVRLALATAADAPLYASSAGGVLTSASTSALIQGIIAITKATNSANPKTCVARYPTVMNEPAA